MAARGVQLQFLIQILHSFSSYSNRDHVTCPKIVSPQKLPVIMIIINIINERVLELFHVFFSIVNGESYFTL